MKNIFYEVFCSGSFMQKACEIGTLLRTGKKLFRGQKITSKHYTINIIYSSTQIWDACFW